MIPVFWFRELFQRHHGDGEPADLERWLTLPTAATARLVLAVSAVSSASSSGTTFRMANPVGTGTTSLIWLIASVCTAALPGRQAYMEPAEPVLFTSHMKKA